MKAKKIVLFAIAIYSASLAFAQEHKMMFEFKERVQKNIEIPSTQSFGTLIDKKRDYTFENNGNLYLDVNALSFVRNTEYFMPYTKGYTALGFIFDPSLRYQLNEKASLSAGAHLLGIAGDDGIKRITPIFRIEYLPTKWLRIVGGTLYANLNHELYEPLFDFERFFYKNDEMGLQIITNARRWEADIWCDWEDFLEKDEAKQERFFFGWHNRFFLTDSKRNFKTLECSIPLDFTAAHRGGQISSLQDTCIETLFNASIGITSAVNSPEFFIKKTTIDVNFFGFKNNSGDSHIHTHYKDGWGIYPNLTIQNKQWKLNAGYWHAHRFISARGSYLFQSRSLFYPDFTKENRNMLTAKLFFEHKFKGLNLGIDTQVFHDTDLSDTDFAFGIYLKMNEAFRILKHRFPSRQTHDF